MNLALLTCKAKVVLEACLGVQEGVTIVLLEDGTLGESLLRAFQVASSMLGAPATTVSVEPSATLSMREFGRFAEASLHEPPVVLPDPCLAALSRAEAAVLLTSDLHLIFDPRFRALPAEHGLRAAWMPYVTAEGVVRLLPDTVEEAVALHEETQAVGERIDEASRIHVTSEEGTALTAAFGEYRTNVSTGIPGAAAGYAGLELWPAGQVARVPDPGSANGTVVIDRSVNAPEYEAVDAPITFAVDGGMVTGIEGGLVARKLRRYLEEVDTDGSAFHLTELGLGTNRRCRQTAQAGPAEDTHRWGCVSLALGTDIHLGGETRAACHVDMTMAAATVTIDGSVIVADGVPQWLTGGHGA